MTALEPVSGGSIPPTQTGNKNTIKNMPFFKGLKVGKNANIAPITINGEEQNVEELLNEATIEGSVTVKGETIRPSNKFLTDTVIEGDLVIEATMKQG